MALLLTIYLSVSCFMPSQLPNCSMMQALPLKPGSLSPVAKGVVALGVASALPVASTQMASIKSFKSAAAVLAMATALPVTTQAATSTNAKATSSVLGFSASYFLANAPSALAATVIKYYNAAANGYPDPNAQVITGAIAEAFCNSQGGQQLCGYNDLCPDGQSGELIGDPKCAAPLRPCSFPNAIFVKKDGSGCASFFRDAYISWNYRGSFPYTCPAATCTNFANRVCNNQVFACCSEDSGATEDTAFCIGKFIVAN